MSGCSRSLPHRSIHLGFNVETVEYKNISFTVWDVGGQVSVDDLNDHLHSFDSDHFRTKFVHYGDTISKTPKVRDTDRIFDGLIDDPFQV